MGARGSSLPRSVYPLLALVVLAALWLWRGGGDPGGPRLLFDVPVESIQACTVRGPNGLTELERTPDGWRLDGTRPDLADLDGITVLLDDIVSALRTDAVGGDGWRASAQDYSLADAGNFEILLTVDGEESRLKIGAQNPASGLFYATGAGSDDLFMVGEDLAGVLYALPNGVRARMLWPGFIRDDPDTVRLRFPGSDTWDLAACDMGGRWWLHMPDDGYARIGRVARDYHERYGDRRKIASGADWLRLRDRAMNNLLSYLEDARVRDFLDPETAMPEDVFAVKIAGRETHEVLFGALETENRAQAWRDGFTDGIVVPGEIPRECAGGLQQYMHTDLLDRGMADADSFAVVRPDLGEVRFVNTGRDWIVSAPAEPADPERLSLMAVDLVHFLDHVAIERVYDSTTDDPQKAPRALIRIWATGPGLPPHTDIICALGKDHSVPTAWYPADGRMAQIDRNLLITCQTVLMAAVGQRR